ncbi:MAG: hypothetical protein KC912_22720 [Proteobacteria bacterium]|nr:hypothetical protein [Pseudomonadota bacterium]
MSLTAGLLIAAVVLGVLVATGHVIGISTVSLFVADRLHRLFAGPDDIGAFRRARLRALGLRDEGGELRRTMQGYELRVLPQFGGAKLGVAVAVKVRLRHGLGHALRFGTASPLGPRGSLPELDPELAYSGSDETARSILLHRRVREVWSDRYTTRFDGEELEFVHAGSMGSETSFMLGAAADLAVAMDFAREVHWRDAAERWSLSVHDECSVLMGTISGLRVEVHERSRGDHVWTDVLVWFEDALPAGTKITREGDTVDLADPILTDRICATGDVAWLRERLCTDAGREAVMSVIHGHPDSAVVEDAVVLRAYGRLGDGLELALEDAVALARVLEPGSNAD